MSEDRRGVALASACGETLIPFCMKGLLGDGDLDRAVGDECVASAGIDGLVSPLRNPDPPGKLSDWSRSTFLAPPRAAGNRFSLELNGGDWTFLLTSLAVCAVCDLCGGLLSVGLLSGLRFESS